MMKEKWPKESGSFDNNTRRGQYEWTILIAIIIIGGLLNGGRFSDTNTETILVVLFLTSIMLWLFLMWKKSVRQEATLFEKSLHFFRIMFGAVLVISIGALIKGLFQPFERYVTVLIILSIFSALGLILMTYLIKKSSSKSG